MVEAIADARNIFPEFLKSGLTPYFFLVKYTARVIVGIIATKWVNINPTMPNWGINNRDSGIPIAIIRMFNFINSFVSPKAVRRLFALITPIITYPCWSTLSDINKAAKGHLFPYITEIIESDKILIAITAGTKNIDVYLTEDLKTVFRMWNSFLGLIFENAGNKTVEIGKIKKVMNWEKFWAIWKLPIITSSTNEAIKKE